MSTVYFSNNLCTEFCNAVTEVFGSIEEFMDFLDDDKYCTTIYDVFLSFDSETYIINRETGEYINWYKYYNVGRDIHTTVNPDSLVKFLIEFKESCKLV